MFNAAVGSLDFEVLFSEHNDHMIRLAGLLTGSNEEAQDIVADVFATLLRHPPGSLGEPRAYLLRCVVNRVSSVGRQTTRRIRARVRMERPDSSPPGFEGPIAERDRVTGALRQLPHKQRAVLVLRYFEDLTEAQTAAVLGLPIGTVKSAGSRGAAALAEQLRGESS
jgi:RNA polymerase sigma factor (sigma-70 family)